MELLEIVVMGLRGVPGQTRVALGQGLSVLHPLDGREAILVRTVLELLYPKGPEAPGLKRLVEPGAQAARIGIGVAGRDGTRYRILKDVLTSKCSLLKEVNGSFQPVTNNSTEVAQVVTATIGFPQEDTLRELFITRKQDLPSQRPQGAGSSASISSPGIPAATSGEIARPPPPGFAGGGGGYSGEFAHLSPEEKQRKLQEIEQGLAHIRKVKELEFELDGLQKQGFELEERLRPYDALKKRVEKAEEALAQYAHLDGLPEDLGEQLQRHRNMQEAHQKELAVLDEKRARLSERLAQELAQARDARSVIHAAFSDPLILWGTLSGVAAILLALIGAFAFEPLRWVAFADIPAFAVALVGAFRFIKEAEVAARIRHRISRIDADRERLKSKFELDDAHFKGLLARYNIAPENLGKVLADTQARAEVKAACEAARQELAAKLGPEAQGLYQQQQEIQARIKALEEQLYELGGYMGNESELKAQAEQLRRELSGEPPPKPAAPVSGPVPSAPGASEVPDLSVRLIDLARDLFLVERDELCKMLQGRVGQYISGFSDRRYQQVVFGPEGAMSLVEAASGQSIPFGQLTPGDRDLAYLSLKLTILEAFCKKTRMPVIFERAFETFPELKDPLFARMLTFLSGMTQVLCMTQRPGVAAAGGQRIRLP